MTKKNTSLEYILVLCDSSTSVNTQEALSLFGVINNKTQNSGGRNKIREELEGREWG